MNVRKNEAYSEGRNATMALAAASVACVSTNVTLEQRSLCYINLQLPASSARFTLGLLAVLTNSLVLAVVWRSKELRSKFFMHVAMLAGIDMVFGLSMCRYAWPILYAHVANTTAITTGWLCIVENQIFVSFALQGTQLANLILTIDRFIAITWPMTYSQLTYRYVLCLHGSSFLFSAAVACSDAILARDLNDPIPYCSVALAARVTFSPQYQNVVTLFSVIIIVVMVATIISTHRRIQKQAFASSNQDLQIKMIKAVIVVGCVYVATWTVGTFGLSGVVGLTTLERQYYGNIIGLLTIGNSSISLLIYLAVLRKFRQAFWQIICCGYGKPLAMLTISILPTNTDTRLKDHHERNTTQI